MSWLSEFFKPKKQDLSLGGTLPFKSLTEIPTGAALNQVILDALQKGKGIGFPSDYTDRTTNPYIASREARFKRIEEPYATSQMSARGLGRSTIAGREIGELGASKERDINELLASAYKENEAQKKLDQSRYEQEAAAFTGGEAAQRGAASADEMARRQYQISGENAQNQQYRQNINQMIGTALSFATGGLPDAATTWGQYTIGNKQYGADELAKAIKEENATTTSATQATPFTKKLNIQDMYNFFKGMK